MVINLFKSKKLSLPKGNTIRKAEPINYRQGRRDFHAEDSVRIKSAVDLSIVFDWLKENAVGCPKNAEMSDRAGLWDLKGPRKSTLVEESVI
jgi:hypothetical protein